MAKRKKQNWVEASVEEVLELTPEEMVLVEFRTALALAVQKARRREHLTQAEAAERIGTSQALVSKMEAGRASITLDRMIKALAALGVSRASIARALGKAA